MNGSSSADTPVITPSRLGRYLDRKLARDRNLRYVGVQGEVSNMRALSNGNVYFSLKDRESVLNCVAFAERAAGFPAFDNGADVVAYGEVKIFARSSIYQLVATRLELGGVGALHAKYEELSAKLQREGLFADERKKALPRFPFRVALVGSSSGDGTRDFITQARQRAPHVALRLFETPVNGTGAVPDIVRAIGAADAWSADLLVVVRGGGSYEDLFGFSDERVVRAIVACRTPTVAAIGHERDVPLIELAADMRASTPSTAAQTALPKREDVVRLVAERATAVRRAFSRLSGARRQAVDGLRNGLAIGLERQIGRARAALAPGERRLRAASPHVLFERRRGRLAQLRESLGRLGTQLTAGRQARLLRVTARLEPAALRLIERRRAELEQLKARFEGHDPEALLRRGYAIVTAGGRLVRSPADAPPGTAIEARVARGTLRARVERGGVDGGEQIQLF